MGSARRGVRSKFCHPGLGGIRGTSGWESTPSRQGLTGHKGSSVWAQGSDHVDSNPRSATYQHDKVLHPPGKGSQWLTASRVVRNMCGQNFGRGMSSVWRASLLNRGVKYYSWDKVGLGSNLEKDIGGGRAAQPRTSPPGPRMSQGPSLEPFCSCPFSTPLWPPPSGWVLVLCELACL